MIFHQSSGDGFRHLRGWIFCLEIFLVPFHPVSRSTCGDGRVVVEQVKVIVCAQVQDCQFRKLADGCRHIAPESEFTQIDGRHTAVGVQFDTGLVTPQVNILVEIPIRSNLKVFTTIVPIFTVKAFPNHFQSSIILEIFIRFPESYLNICLSCPVVADLED